PPGVAGAGRRRGPGDSSHVRSVLGARPGADAAVGRGGDAGAAAARPASAAAPHRAGRGRGPGGDPARPRPPPARPADGHRRRHRHGGAGVRGAGAAADRHDLLVFRRPRAARRRRHQRGQRDPGGLPRLRYLWRNHGAGHRGADGVRAAAPLPAGRRERRPAAPADRPGRPGAGRAGHQDDRADRPDDGADGAGAPAAADRGADFRVRPAARPQPARRRLRGRADLRHGRDPAVHGGRGLSGRVAQPAEPAESDRHRPAVRRHGGGDGSARLQTVPGRAGSGHRLAAGG
ncbi:hypothetical protein OY671_008345, partial [Metschnikowia pulcherrima]